MNSISRRLEGLASRSSALMEHQGEVFHRFIARLQVASTQIESLSFDEIADTLEDVIKGQEEKVQAGKESRS